MKPKQSNGKGKRTGNRGIKNLPVSNAKAKDAKGGSTVVSVMNAVGSALQSVARKG